MTFYTLVFQVPNSTFMYFFLYDNPIFEFEKDARIVSNVMFIYNCKFTFIKIVRNNILLTMNEYVQKYKLHQI